MTAGWKQWPTGHALPEHGSPLGTETVPGYSSVVQSRTPSFIHLYMQM